MLHLLTPVAGDILFFPTISEHDLDGLSDCLDNCPQGLEATWHFLFRRNIYTGARAAYSAQDAGLENLRLVFEQVQHGAMAGGSYFYTDTDELTEQYNRLGVVRFHTLPVPHTYQASDAIPHSRPLRITYLGDARTEKGFPLLPDLAGDLEAEYLATGRAKLVIQCNYNIPGGEPKSVVARSQLECLPPGYAEFYRKPLTSEEYQRLLLTSDVNLLCYDPVNYYARSSGILVESLAVGIPVLVPSGCWLARQFQIPYLKYVEGLGSRMTLLATRDMSGVPWRIEKDSDATPCDGGLLQLQHGARTYAFLDIPHGATHLLLRGEFAMDAKGALASVCEVGWDGEPCRDAREFCIDACAQGRTALCAELVRGAARVRIGLGSTHPSERIWLKSLAIEFLRAPASGSIPRGAVGLVYHSVAEIPGLVREMIDHYPHYRRTAIEFSEDWRNYHNSTRLLEEMEAVAGLTRRRDQSLRSRAQGATV